MTKKIDKKIIKRLVLDIIFPSIALAVILLFWVTASAVKGNPLVLPMPGIVIKRFFLLWKENKFWLSVGKTILRTAISFSISFAVALTLAIIAGICRSLNKIIAPIVAFFRAAPTVAVILILYAFMSTYAMSVAVGFLIAFPIMYSSFFSAIADVDPDLIKMAKIYKVNFFSRIFNIYFLEISPGIFDAAGATLSLTMKVIIAAEILTSVNPGVGGKIQSAYSLFEIEYLLSWTLLAIVLSMACELFVGLLKKICVRWEK